MAYGSVPERIVDLLLAIAADDTDVLDDPQPSALLEELGESALSLRALRLRSRARRRRRVKHGLSAEVQRRFAEEGIGIAYPTHEVHLCRVPEDLTRAIEINGGAAGSSVTRLDPAAVAPPTPHLAESAMSARKFSAVVDAGETIRPAMEP